MVRSNGLSPENWGKIKVAWEVGVSAKSEGKIGHIRK